MVTNMRHSTQEHLRQGERIFTDFLHWLGEDPTREGLKETPMRMAKAWLHKTRGYGQDPVEVLKTFVDGASKYDEMVVVKDLPFYSLCEHHGETVFGTATIGYIPDGCILGLSKLARLLDLFACRLQCQERLTVQVADALETLVKPKGVGVFLNARHMCMECRGVEKQGHSTDTIAVRGVLATKPHAKQEFLLRIPQQ